MENKTQKIYDFLIKPENEHLKEFVKSFDEPDGFTFSISKEYLEIMDTIDEDGHSGLSLALSLRQCQNIFLKEQE